MFIDPILFIQLSYHHRSPVFVRIVSDITAQHNSKSYKAKLGIRKQTWLVFGHLQSFQSLEIDLVLGCVLDELYLKLVAIIFFSLKMILLS